MLTHEQSELLERQQTKALQFIFGVGLSARVMRTKAGIETLKERRVSACKKFAKTTLENDRFREWFPLRPAATRERRTSVSYKKYVELPARTDRCYNSPLYHLRRVLNEEC